MFSAKEVREEVKDFVEERREPSEEAAFMDLAAPLASAFVQRRDLFGLRLMANAAGMDIIASIEARKTYAAEDWLILITTDHGGVGGGHGGSSFEERMTFIISNKTIL